MVFVVLTALRNAPAAVFSYQILIVAGLCGSLAGDVFMMLENKQVLAGMACFFVALSFYIWGFTKGIKASFVFWPLVILIVYAVAFTRKLFPYLGRKKIPVLLYVAAMTIMVWLAAERYNQIREIHALSAYTGAVLFLISDSAWALDQFIRKHRHSQILILASYFAAQVLIALSVH